MRAEESGGETPAGEGGRGKPRRLCRYDSGLCRLWQQGGDRASQGRDEQRNRFEPLRKEEGEGGSSGGEQKAGFRFKSL